MKKDIDKELNKLMIIKNRVSEFNNLMKNTDIILISQCSYDSLSNKLLCSDLIFYIIPNEILEYVEEDNIIVTEDDRVYIYRDGKCIKVI